jgi:hypothetical protein
MKEIQTLPFALTPEAVDSWLAALETAPVAEKINQLNKIASELLSSAIGAETMLMVLSKLKPPVLMLASILERQYMADTSPAAQEKQAKYKALSLQLPKKLFYLYGKVAADPALAEADRALCFYRAIQIAGLLARRAALYYEGPDLSLWKKLGELYQEIIGRKLQDIRIEDDVPGLARHATLDSALRHVLLFQAVNPYLLSPREIADIFAAAGRLSSLVVLDVEPSEASCWQWNTAGYFPPLTGYQDTKAENTLYLNTEKLADYLESHPDEAANRQLIACAWPRLTAYRGIIRSVRPSSQIGCGLMVGNKQMSRFLTSLISRYRILELSGEIKTDNRSKKLELVPLEVKAAMGHLSTKVLQDDRSLAVSQVKLFLTDNKAFYTTKLRNANFTFGEPALLLAENKKPLFGVLRHIRNEAGVELANILIEAINGDVYPFDGGDIQGFLIVETAGEIDLFLPPTAGLSVGHTLTEKSAANRSFRIEKFIEMTANFSRYRVVCC